MNKAFKTSKKWKATRYYRLYQSRMAIRRVMAIGRIAAGLSSVQQIKAYSNFAGENQALLKAQKGLAVSREMIKTFEATNRILKGEA